MTAILPAARATANVSRWSCRSADAARELARRAGASQRAGAAIPARSRALRELRPPPDHRDGAAGGHVPRLPLLLVVLRHDAEARGGDRRSARAGAAPRPDQPRRGDRQQRRLPLEELRRPRRAGCSASSRRGTSRRSPRSAACARWSSSSEGSSAPRSRQRERAPTCSTRTT